MLLGDVVLALPLLESHHRDLARGGEGLDRGDKLLADLLRQTRRGERRPTMLGEERRDPTRVGQLRHIRVAVDPIDAFQLGRDVLGEHVRGGQG